MFGISFVRRSFAARRVLLALTLTAVAALGVLTSSNLAGVAPPEPPNPAAPPLDFVPDEKSDLSGDKVEDLMLSSPADPHHPRPGKVYVRSGDGGSTMTTLRGQRNNDWFGYAVSIVGDIGPGGGDGVLDLLVGAPKD